MLNKEDAIYTVPHLKSHTSQPPPYSEAKWGGKGGDKSYRAILNEEQYYISNALDEMELQYLMKIQSSRTKSSNILITTGQHPLYPENSITTEKTIELLEQNKLFAIGEIGLDKRHKNLEWQKEVFLNFLDIANQFKKPVFIHCVGYHYDLYTLIKRNFPDLRYIFHSFQGSVEMIKEFSKLNIIFSLHENIINTKKSKITIKEIIEKHDFAFETDMDSDGMNDVFPTIQKIAEFIKKDIDLLVERQYAVFQSL